MSDDRNEVYESLRAAAARRGPVASDPEAEQVMDNAITAARPRTQAHMRALLETHEDAAWAALLDEESSPDLGSFGAVVEILVRTRAEYETFARTSAAFEESVASAFAEAVASHDNGDGEVMRVADAMLSGSRYTKTDVKQLAARMEEV